LYNNKEEEEFNNKINLKEDYDIINNKLGKGAFG